MVMKVAYTIVKQIIEKLALLTIKKHWTKNYKISIFKAFFALYFLVSVESTSSSSAYLENSLQFSFPEPFVIMLIGIKFLLFLITSVSSSVLRHASGNSIMTLLFCVL